MAFALIDCGAMPRSAWRAPTDPSPTNFAPLDLGIVIHWNGPGMGAYLEGKVPELVLGTWRYHTQQNGWADIAYNYSVDRFGRIWTGRGDFHWNAASGTSDANSRLMAVECLCGIGDELTPAMLDGLKRFVRAYVATGRKASVVAHRNVTQTACPGDELYAFVQYLNAYAANPIDEPEPIEVEVPEYLVQSTNKTVYAVYADGRCRQLIYPELQYLQQRSPDMTMVQTTNLENDQIIYDRSRLS